MFKGLSFQQFFVSILAAENQIVRKRWQNLFSLASAI
jgi:hypothetical protein